MEIVSIPGEVQLSGYVVGSGKQAIIILHGFTNCARDFRSYAQHLADQGFLVAAFDARGHGSSGGKLTVDGMVEDVGRIIDFLRERGVESFALLGYSMGGSVATIAATQYPVEAAVAICAPVLSKIRHGPELIKEMAILEIERQDLGLKRHLHVVPIRPFKQFRDNMQRVESSHVEVPYLFIIGDDDCFTEVADARTFVRGLPHAELAVLPGDHLIPFTEEETIFHLVRDFFGKHLPRK